MYLRKDPRTITPTREYLDYPCSQSVMLRYNVLRTSACIVSTQAILWPLLSLCVCKIGTNLPFLVSFRLRRRLSVLSTVLPRKATTCILGNVWLTTTVPHQFYVTPHSKKQFKDGEC
jgi:hypothetical protein